MSLQAIINMAQSVEFTRTSVVAQTASRNGRLFVQERSSVKPWVFTIEPPAHLPWIDYRSVVEAIFSSDRHTEHLIYFGQATYGNSGQVWMNPYQGSLTFSGSGGYSLAMLDYIYITATSGNTITIDVSNAGIPAGTTIFKAGDYIQPSGTGSDSLPYRYPYTVAADVVKSAGQTTKVITINRNFIAQTNYNPVSSTTSQNRLTAGSNCHWNVLVTKLPSVKYVPHRSIQFTGNFDCVESVI